MSGFPKRAESVHDAFDTGHASTAVSAALGMARAMQLRGEEGCAVALVGDGALSGGMAFEALNDAGASEAPLVVILNDNGMSIAANVGSLRRSLLNMRTARATCASSAPSCARSTPGRWAAPSRTAWRSSKTASRISCCRTCSLRSWALPIWAPSTGTTSASWCACCAARGRCAAPCWCTRSPKKGRGYAPAERDPERFHGVPPAGGEPCRRSNSEAFGEALVRLAERDERVVAVCAAMPGGTGLSAFPGAVPGAVFRRGHRRTARRHHGRRHGRGRPAPGGGDLFLLFAARL